MIIPLVPGAIYRADWWRFGVGGVALAVRRGRARSAPLEHRLALLVEGLHALAEILQGARPAIAVLDPNDRGADAFELAVALVLDGARSTTREAD